MTDLERIRTWLLTCPEMERLQSVRIDYLTPESESGSIRPSGLVEISRTEDLVGNITVQNRYNFGLYYVLSGQAEEDTVAIANAQWLLSFQQWVQQQSLQHLAPTFGDEPETERMMAQNGVLNAINQDGTATYLVQLTADFKKYYEVI